MLTYSELSPDFQPLTPEIPGPGSEAGSPLEPTAIAADRRETDKKVKSKHRKSISRDGDFVHALWALLESGDAPAELTHLVGMGFTVLDEGEERRRDVGIGEAEVRGGKTSGARRSLPPITLPLSGKSRRPPPWRDVGDELRVLFFNLGLKAMGSHYSVTVRLRDDVEALARSHGPRCLEWLRRRASHHLQASLNRPVDFWFVAEEDRNQRLHLHGELGITWEEFGAASAALRKAGGEWSKESRRLQVLFRGKPDLRGAGYAAADLRLTRPGHRTLMARYGNPKQHTVSFEGKALSATQGVISRAEQIYTSVRADLISRREIKKAS